MNLTHIPFAQLVAELQQLCRERRTGTVYLTTDDNHLAQLSLEKGEIVYLFFQGKRGADTLPLMQQINAGRVRFVEGPIASFRTPLPSTPEVFRNLVGAAGQVEATAVKKSVPPALLSDTAKVVLEKALAEYIGPMAAIVCAECFENARDLESAVEALAGEIPKPDQAVRFREDVRSKLKTIR